MIIHTVFKVICLYLLAYCNIKLATLRYEKTSETHILNVLSKKYVRSIRCKTILPQKENT